MPVIAIAVTLKSKGQWIRLCERENRNPNMEFIEMINKDVPTAVFIGRFKKLTSTGIIKKPPPAPIKPVIAPTNMP